MDQKVGIYLRISKADRVQRKGNLPSESIEHQLALIRQWLATDPQLRDRHQIIFADDGYSGLREDRPAYEKLLAQIIQGKLCALIVKDFSRLSRDHLVLSEWREELIPELGLILVSIGDGYDSRSETMQELGMSFRSIYYEYYCRDISKKVKLALRAKKESGEYAVARVPVGYRRQKETGEWKICEAEAQMIRQIYEMAAAGMSCVRIAEQWKKDSARIWSILHNPVYVGCQVWHKYENRIGRTKRTAPVQRSDWEVREGKHPAIISPELYERVQRMGEKRGASETGIRRKRHLFHGLTKCLDCGRALCMDRRRKGILCCNHCSTKEEKRIPVEELRVLCLKQFAGLEKEEWQLQMGWETAGWTKAEPDQRERNAMELFLHMMIQKIEVGKEGDIVIWWNFIK